MDIDNIPSSLILDGVIVEQNNPAYSIVLCNKAAKKVNATLAKERDHSLLNSIFNCSIHFSGHIICADSFIRFDWLIRLDLLLEDTIVAKCVTEYCTIEKSPYQK